MLKGREGSQTGLSHFQSSTSPGPLSTSRVSFCNRKLCRIRRRFQKQNASLQRLLLETTLLNHLLFNVKMFNSVLSPATANSHFLMLKSILMVCFPRPYRARLSVGSAPAQNENFSEMWLFYSGRAAFFESSTGRCRCDERGQSFSGNHVDPPQRCCGGSTRMSEI
jgi:hypothetical protein